MGPVSVQVMELNIHCALLSSIYRIISYRIVHRGRYDDVLASYYIVKCLDEADIEALACARKFSLYVTFTTRLVGAPTGANMRNCGNN